MCIVHSSAVCVCVSVAALCGQLVYECIGMEMLKIEKVVVGGEMMSTPAEIKSEPVITPVQPCKHSTHLYMQVRHDMLCT